MSDLSIYPYTHSRVTQILGVRYFVFIICQNLAYSSRGFFPIELEILKTCLLQTKILQPMNYHCLDFPSNYVVFFFKFFLEVRDIAKSDLDSTLQGSVFLYLTNTLQDLFWSLQDQKQFSKNNLCVFVSKSFVNRRTTNPFLL